MKCSMSMRTVCSALLCALLVHLRMAWARPSSADTAEAVTSTPTTTLTPMGSSSYSSASATLPSATAAPDSSTSSADALFVSSRSALPDQLARPTKGHSPSPLASTPVSVIKTSLLPASAVSPTPSSPAKPEPSDYFDYYYEEVVDPDQAPPLVSGFRERGDGEAEEELTRGNQPPPGLSRVAKLRLIKTPRRQPPEYMLELYDKFSRGSNGLPTVTPTGSPEVTTYVGHDGEDFGLSADIVRSFPNINKEEWPGEKEREPAGSSQPEEEEEQQEQQLPGRETRHHTLVFNITSLLTGEEVFRAELRLFTLVEQDQNTYVGLDRVVKVYDGLQARAFASTSMADGEASTTDSHEEEVSSSRSSGNSTEATVSVVLPGNAPVVMRHVYGITGGWEAFDVTEVVRSWVRGEKRESGIGSGQRSAEEAGGRNAASGGPGVDGIYVLEVSIDSIFVHNNTFSRPDLGVHAAHAPDRNATPPVSRTHVDIDVDPEHAQGPLLVVFSRDLGFARSHSPTSHARRSRARSSSSVRQKQQDLRTLISHEPSADAAEALEDSKSSALSQYPVSESVSGKSHASSRSVHRGSPSQDVASDSAATASRELFLPVGESTNKHAEQTPEVEAALRVRRENSNSTNGNKKKRNSCRRKALYVNFQDINWSQWIIAPDGYMAFECVGKCYVPIGAHLSPTKHAIIQTLVHTADPKAAARACCVPTKLEPISILYLDENGVITYKYHYDDMVVAECGCR